MATKTYGSTHERAKRGTVSGWSPGAARRNVAFLRSVDETALTGHGLAATLTLRTCPPTPQIWSQKLRTFIERQRKRGLLRLHWVMEMQARGVPHLHAALWFDDYPAQRKATQAQTLRLVSAERSLHRTMPRDDANLTMHAVTIVADWIDVMSDFEPGYKAQQIRPIEGPVGWFVYMSKHCGRGSKHYQRQQESMPEAWETSPRVWGHRGDWALVEPMQGELTQSQFFQLRRRVRGLRISQAKQKVGDGWPADHLPGMRRVLRELGKPTLRHELRHLGYCRRMLNCPKRELSEVRGISEWIDQDTLQQLMRNL